MTKDQIVMVIAIIAVSLLLIGLPSAMGHWLG